MRRTHQQPDEDWAGEGHVSDVDDDLWLAMLKRNQELLTHARQCCEVEFTSQANRQSGPQPHAADAIARNVADTRVVTLVGRKRSWILA
jgi:hypothetical protein